MTKSLATLQGFWKAFFMNFYYRNNDSERASLTETASKIGYLPDLADLLEKEMSSSKENMWQHIHSLFCKQE